VNTAIINRLTRHLLFEGFALYPYRVEPVAQRRSSLGRLAPRGWCETAGEGMWAMQSEVLVRGALSIADIRIRFLHLRERIDSEAPRWEEAKEHEIALPLCSVAELADRPRSHRIEIAGAVERDSQRDVRKAIVRRAEPLCGVVELSAAMVTGAVARLRVRVINDTALEVAGDRDAQRRIAARASLASTHTLIGISDGALLSLRDPPVELADAAAACRNEGTWPVLVGERGATDTILSSPIMLHDYPSLPQDRTGER
jgi:hypothetical protein